MHTVRMVLLTLALCLPSAAQAALPKAEKNFSTSLLSKSEYEGELATRAWLPYLWEDSLSSFHLCIVREVTRYFRHPVFKKDLRGLVRAASDSCEEEMTFFRNTYENAGGGFGEERKIQKTIKEWPKFLEEWIQRYSK